MPFTPTKMDLSRASQFSSPTRRASSIPRLKFQNSTTPVRPQKRKKLDFREPENRDFENRREMGDMPDADSRNEKASQPGENTQQIINSTPKTTRAKCSHVASHSPADPAKAPPCKVSPKSSEIFSYLKDAPLKEFSKFLDTYCVPCSEKMKRSSRSTCEKGAVRSVSKFSPLPSKWAKEKIAKMKAETLTKVNSCSNFTYLGLEKSTRDAEKYPSASASQATNSQKRAKFVGLKSTQFSPMPEKSAYAAHDEIILPHRNKSGAFRPGFWNSSKISDASFMHTFVPNWRDYFFAVIYSVLLVVVYDFLKEYVPIFWGVYEMIRAR